MTSLEKMVLTKGLKETEEKKGKNKVKELEQINMLLDKLVTYNDIEHDEPVEEIRTLAAKLDKKLEDTKYQVRVLERDLETAEAFIHYLDD